MRFNNLKKIVVLFVLIITFITASDIQIPNTIILDNPVKEVTTVEGLKNRDAAEVNIKVKKREVEEIEGFESPDGIEFILPDGTLLVNEEIKVVKSLANFPVETSKNKRRKRSLSSVETPSIIIDSGDKKIVKIAKEEAENTNYIILFNKKTDKVSKVYKGSVQRSNNTQGNNNNSRSLGNVYIDKADGLATDKILYTTTLSKYDNYYGLYAVSSNEAIVMTSQDSYGMMEDDKIKLTNRGISFSFKYDYDTRVARYATLIDSYGKNLREQVGDYLKAGREGTTDYLQQIRIYSNGATELYGKIKNLKVRAGITMSALPKVGVYELYHRIYVNFGGKDLRSEELKHFLIVKDSQISSLKYSIRSDIEMNQKAPLDIDRTQELSFYNNSATRFVMKSYDMLKVA